MSETFVDVFGSSVKNLMQNIHTAVPAVVVSFNAAARKVSAKPTVREKKSGNRFVDMPTVHEVPVQYPSSGNAGLTFPLSRGDFGMLIFSQSDIEAWCQRGGTQNPGSDRHWDLTDAIFIPGVWPFSASEPEVDNDKLILRYKNTAIKMGTKIQIEGLENLADILKDLVSAVSNAITTGSPVSHVMDAATKANLATITAKINSLME